MKPLSFLILPALLCSCQGPVQSDAADDSATGAEPAVEWTSLFDGQSFAHWRGYDQKGMPAGWVVDGDAMFASEPGSGMDLVSKETYTDFVLEFEWKVSEGGNSGVMWHVDESAGNYPWMTGPEYQILDDAAYNDGAVGKNSAGSNYDVHVPTEAKTLAAGEWNASRVVVDGAHVEHWLNGTMVVEYEKGSDDWKERVAASKWSEVPTYASTTSGHIAIQGDHGRVWFRNLRIRRLLSPK